MPHRHSHEKTQSRVMRHRTSMRGARRASEEAFAISSDFSASEESGSVSPSSKQRRGYAVAGVVAAASGAPKWLQGLPTPARANLGKKEDCHVDVGAGLQQQAAVAPSYRELLRARGKELIRHSKLSQQRNGALPQSSACCDASSNASTDVPDLSPGETFDGVSGFNLSPNSSGQTFDGASGFNLSPITPHSQPHYQHMPMPGPTMSDFGMPLGMMDMMPPPTYHLQLSHALLDMCPPISPLSPRQYHDMDQMMSTLMPERHLMDNEELAAQLRAAVPCCYED